MRLPLRFSAALQGNFPTCCILQKIARQSQMDIAKTNSHTATWYSQFRKVNSNQYDGREKKVITGGNTGAFSWHKPYTCQRRTGKLMTAPDSFDTNSRTRELILASIGAIKETILPDEEVIGELLYYMSRIYPAALIRNYNLKSLSDTPRRLLEQVEISHGCIDPSARIDTRRTAQMVLKNLRDGKFGRVSLEWPDGRG